jgi:hypothetical protein
MNTFVYQQKDLELNSAGYWQPMELTENGVIWTYLPTRAIILAAAFFTRCNGATLCFGSPKSNAFRLSNLDVTNALTSVAVAYYILYSYKCSHIWSFQVGMNVQA